MSNEKKYKMDAEDVACTILAGIEFKTEASMIQAIKNVSDVITTADQQTASLQKRIKGLEDTKQAYQECFELYMPDNKKDEASLFLSTFNNGLAKDMANKQK